ncbi:MAG TPA: FeoA family protein, partial [Croceibacterium sp.]
EPVAINPPFRHSALVTDSTTLDLLPPRRRAEIVSVDWDQLAPEEAKRLRALGIEEGARVAVEHRGIFAGHDPLALRIGRMTVAIRRNHARAMTVETL